MIGSKTTSTSCRASCAISLVWFYLATFVIVPAYAVNVYDVAESGYFQRYGALGDSPADIFKSFFTRPGVVWQIATEPARVDYLWNLLAVFGFAGLLAPEIVLLSLPVLLANLLSAYPAQYYGEFHYTAPLVPYFAVSAVYGTARMWRFLARRFSRHTVCVPWVPRATHGTHSGSFQHMPASSAPVMALVSVFTNARTTVRPLLAGALILWIGLWTAVVYAEHGRGPLGGRYAPTPITAHHRLLERFVAQIPDDAAVSATAAVHPHVSHRRYIYQFPLGIDPPGRADWVLLDVTTNTDMAPGDLKARVEAMLAGDWGVIDAADGFLLLRKGAPEKAIPDAFYDFARSPDKFTIHNSQSFGSLTFLTLDLEDWRLWRQTKVTTIWRVEDSFEPGNIHPWLELRTPDGEVLYTDREMAPPALVWYPPERWQPGEVIRIETLWLFLPRVWGAVVGVTDSPNPADAGNPLAVDVGQSEPLLAEATGTQALVGAFARQPDGRLHALPVALPVLPEAALRTAHAGLEETAGYFGIERVGRITAWFPRDGGTAGKSLDVWLRWQHVDPTIFDRYQAFVHLRRDGVNVAQRDGLPRYFVPLAHSAVTLLDWRQFALPIDLPPGKYTIFIGLFDPDRGERLAAFDTGGRPVGNELLVGTVEIRPPLIPDQACALIPPACASQVD